MIAKPSLLLLVPVFAGMLWLTGCQTDLPEDKRGEVKVTDDAWDNKRPELRADDVAMASLKAKSTGGTHRFVLLSPKESGIEFTNRIDTMHPLKRLYTFGFGAGGVAVGDVDGDGQPDLYLVSGPEKNRLFRQTGPWKFVDETSAAGVDGGEAWGAGAAMVDIDNDGDLDIYVCNYDAPNQLFINNGKGKFREAAKEWGLDLIDACLMPSFLDYDADGDLDVFVLTNRYQREGGRPKSPPFAMANGKPYVLPEFEKYYTLRNSGGNKIMMDDVGRSDYMFRNNGNGTFTDVSKSVGITEPGQGLSSTCWDFNQDGLPDIYVANDFNDPDHLYRNNGDGTFTDVLAEVIPHTSWFSMGADFGDLNDDGRFDLLVADMSATSHYGQKTTMGAMNEAKLAMVAGPPPQIMRNALYVNSGVERFFEAAELAGLADTDWTWSIKLADFDCDGRNDIFVSNGAARNFNHSDHIARPNDLIGRTEWDIYEDGPPRPEQNLVFRNQGDLQFEDVSKDWGLDAVSMSFATAYSDLDRDGDLDLIVMNLDQPVSVYRNDTIEGNRLLVDLRGIESNTYGIGATIEIETDNGHQIRMLSPQTGFLSSNEPRVHFGLGDADRVNSLKVRWPSGQVQTVVDIKANQLVTLVEPAQVKPAQGKPAGDASPPPRHSNPTWFQTAALGTEVAHRETPYDDFADQPLLPNKLSQLGPGIAVADFDADRDDDFFIGGSAGFAGQLMVNENGVFHPQDVPALEADRGHEDMGAVWFDADGDGDLDLYVVSGGVERMAGDGIYQDRLYLNDGKGKLEPAPEGTLPKLADSGSCVVAADFDRDGDLDLFVGSRVIPRDFPSSPISRLLENRSGKFVDVTEQIAPGLKTAGLVTGAVWSDADDDGWPDLLLSTEWGPIRLFGNEAGKLVDKTSEAGLANRQGWWNGIAARDLDGDGDIDYVVSNFGLNTKYHATAEKPLLLYYGDFDGSGTKQLIEAEYESATLFPIRGKSCSTRAMPALAKKFDTYHAFASASITEIYSEECLSKAETYSVSTLESGAWINDGKGVFQFQPLPRIAQVAPGFGMVLTEVNGDGFPDLYLVQNFFTPQVETGRMDGGLSLLMFGNGDGTFRPVLPDASGLVVPGDAKAAAEIDLNSDARSDLLVSVNNDLASAFANAKRKDQVKVSHDAKTTDGKQILNDREVALLRIELVGRPGNPTAVGAKVILRMNDGKCQAAEVSAGHGYLSQSTPVISMGLPLDNPIKSIQIRWPNGKTSEQAYDGQNYLRIVQPE